MNQNKLAGYIRFGAMILTSMIVMYILMYLNSYELDHVRFSETRLYMTFIMGAAMAVVMLSFMWGMYKDLKTNLAIYVGSVIVFVIALFLVRSQATVGDQSCHVPSTSYLRLAASAGILSKNAVLPGVQRSIALSSCNCVLDAATPEFRSHQHPFGIS